MSDDVEHKRLLKRFRKAQKILDMTDDEYPYELDKLAHEGDPHLVQDYVKYLDWLVESSDSDHMKYLDLHRFKAELDDRYADDVIEYLSYGEPNFQTYDNAALKLSDRVNFVALTNEFRESRNRYFVIEGFIALVRAKISPPAWMLEAVAQGFSKHFRDPQPTNLARQLGLQGDASGKTNPYDEYCRLIARRKIVVEMLILIKAFGISQVNAARAVKIKGNLSVSTKTLCNDYRKYEKERKDAILNLDLSLSTIGRQKFVERFPVSARKLLKKNVPLKK